MSADQTPKAAERQLPGRPNHGQRFAEAEHAENAGATLKRVVRYFIREKGIVAGMLAVALFGTLCGIYAPSLQSRAVDIIAGERAGRFAHTLILMLVVYLLYSASGLLQGLLSARLSQNVVKRMREELFGKIVDLPIRYLDAHSHGDVMSRMTNDIENISTTVSQSLPSLCSSVLTIAGAERVFAVLDETNEDKGGEALQKAEMAEAAFRNLRFSYDGKNPVIQNFSLTVPAGKKVALVGATGSGKTTIVNLLMRFYELDGGEICINGQNIRGVARDSLRKNAAIVLQDTTLFSDTVRNNLKYGNERASDEQLKEAAKMSRCDDMIRRLPQGYDTVLTGSGAAISQGQRQLLAIARAFVADPQILILDEATSNVDTRTEKAIQDAMQRVMQGRTSIVIAHRLSTIRDSDLIVVMDRGEIVESGSHEALLAQKGKYYDLYMTQYAGFAI